MRRHNVRQRTLDPRSPLSVGNGEFAFTMDLTGLQTLPRDYPVGPREDALPPGTLLGTQSAWGWHSTPGGEHCTLAGSTVLYDSPRGPVPYVDMVGDIVNDRETGTSAAETWLRANPHRLDLGRIGFHLLQGGTGRPLSSGELSGTSQTLDLWTGTVTSTFTVAGHPAKVTTACHPDRDELGIRVESTAVRDGLVIGIDFPYGSEAWHNAAGWEQPEAHTTRLGQPHPSELHPGSTSWIVHRELDNARYQVVVSGQGLTVDQTGTHHVRIHSCVDADPAVLDLSIAFLTAGDGDCIPRGGAGLSRVAGKAGASTPLPPGAGHPMVAPPLPGSTVAAASASHWPRFWGSGGAVELAATADPRAAELERRIVLSQYLTAVNCSGSLPPQETGLVCNSWRGRFHLEMHWWHAAHFAHWNRVELLLPSLRWYATVLEGARETARGQGFDGARWPKQTGPDGRESPSPIGTFLIWQQPHPIHMAELVYRSRPCREVLEEFADIVFESAHFMAGFAHPTPRGFELGPPSFPRRKATVPSAGPSPTPPLNSRTGSGASARPPPGGSGWGWKPCSPGSRWRTAWCPRACSTASTRPWTWNPLPSGQTTPQCFARSASFR